MLGHSCVTARVLAPLAIGLAACMAISGCSSTSSPAANPYAYPSVLADPTPRDGTPLSPDEVKQVMDNLISERNHLCAEAVATSGAKAPNASNCTDAATSGAGNKP